MLYLVTLITLLFVSTRGDVYMQACRGSNNRLDEQGRDRANGDRLFDSQNNNRGGYNVGRLTYYSGEKVPISWSNQHSSGTYQLKGAELIVQYACGELMRDGTTTNRIPDYNYDCLNYDCDTDVEYGRHESYMDYHQCRAHERNKGLFIANQNLNGRHGAIYTRQNPNGNRRGYECPEERDYYPYWRPSIWRDIVIFTNQVERCSAYKSESQNVKGKWQCEYTDDYWTEVMNEYASMRGDLPLNETLCRKGMMVEYMNKTYNKYHWVKTRSHGISKPDCRISQTTRANHHGTLGGRSYWTYMWEVPDLSKDDIYKKKDYSQCCVVRLRYNITTNDYMAWESDKSINSGLDWRNNSKESSPNADNDPAWVKIWENFGLTYYDVYQSFNRQPDSYEQKHSRGYVFRNNPRVDPFDLILNYSSTESSRVQLRLAINTNQFGRTFEDRTHCFTIKDRPSGIPKSKNIHLLTVQGKRGNIVQVYPATEYFFIPEPATVQKNDYVHFCWTGSNTNPNNNAGQGDAGTDRSNICVQTEPQYSKKDYSDIDGNEALRDSNMVRGDLGNNYPNFVDKPTYWDDVPRPEDLWYPHQREISTPRLGGLSQDIVNDLCTTRRHDDDELLDYGNMEELNGAPTTFCIPPVQVTEEGVWNFLCTRNNNFSNRSHKGILIVGFLAGVDTFSVGQSGVSSSAGSGTAIVNVNPGMVTTGSTIDITVSTWSPPGQDSSIVEVTGVDGAEFDNSALVDNGWIELWIPYTPASLSYPKAYRRADGGSKWKGKGSATIGHKYGTSYAILNIKNGGFYKVENEANVAYVIVAIIAFGVLGSVLFCLVMKKITKA